MKTFSFKTFSRRKIRLSIKTIVAILGISTIIVFSVGINILTLPKMNYQGNYDCAIVLGAAVNGQEPSPVFEARIKHGIDLYQQKIVKTLIFTGGLGAGDQLAEGEAGAIYAQKKGVPAGDIFIENKSKTTIENLRYAKTLMDKHRLKTAIIVSDHLHLRRSLAIAQWVGIQAGSAATPYSRYRSWRTKRPFLLREIYFSIQFKLVHS